MQKQPSILPRVILSVILTIFFYVLAISLVLGLLSIPLIEILLTEELHLKIAIFALLGAGTVLWSIIPKKHKFEEPGPRIILEQHPKLFNELKYIAEKGGQTIPEEVYLLMDANAAVTQIKKNRRVMFIGFPLLHTLTISEFRAIISHEFGHFHSGDTKVGPMIYKTRQIIERTIQNADSLVYYPFLWYGKLYLRITQAISRRQELAADKLAVEISGKKPFVDGLTKIVQLSPPLTYYLNYQFLPVIEEGYIPSFSEGFVKILNHPIAKENMNTFLKNELVNEKKSPYDSHPSLSDRIESVRDLNEFKIKNNPTKAITLLENPTKVEKEVLSFLIQKEHFVKLKPILWKDVARVVYVQKLKRSVEKDRDVLSTIKISEVWNLMHNQKELIETIKIIPSINEEREKKLGNFTYVECMSHTFNAFGSAFAYSLLLKGWTIRELPGEFIMKKGKKEIDPFLIVNKVFSEKITLKQWNELCKDFNLKDTCFGK